MQTIRPFAASPRVAPKSKGNGNGNGSAAESQLLDMRLLLRALQAVRDGDFSVRLPSDMTGLAGKIADTFNEIVLSNQQMAQRAGARRSDRRQGGQDPASHDGQSPRRLWDAMETCVNTLIDDLLWPTTEVTRTITAVAKGDLSQTDAPGSRRTSAAGRIPALRHGRQRDDSSR